jgi:transposase
MDGMHFRRIARQLGVHHQSVINWINATAEQLPDVPPQPSQVDTFVGTKKNALTS